MFVGVLRLTLHLPEPGSLKSKRHLLRSALDRVKARFNVSVAEVADNDLWQRSVVGVTAVGNSHAFVNETLDKVADFVAGMHGGQLDVIDRALAIETFPDGEGVTAGTRSMGEAEELARGRGAGGDPAEGDLREDDAAAPDDGAAADDDGGAGRLADAVERFRRRNRRP